MNNKKIGVIGAGSWGTALAISLSKKGHQVDIWDIDEKHINSMIENRENMNYLPNVKLPENLKPTDNINKVMENKDVFLFAVPAQYYRKALESVKTSIDKNIILVDVAKGIELGTLKRMSEVTEEVIGKCKYVCLSGPSHAEEVALELPTTVVVAGENLSVVKEVQDIFISDALRVYTGEDIIGVEIGGALKNIIALGAGISDGMGYGDNAKAAMITRGLAEIQRLGIKMGAKAETFAGLTGMGDLIVTCTSQHSRNRKCGIMIGKGIGTHDAIKKVGMVVEGVYTTEAAYELACKESVEMPITEGIYSVIKEKRRPEEVVKALMKREKKSETIGAYDE